MILPFGKYKGCKLEHLGDDYLYWLVFEAKDISKRLREAADAELDKRLDADRAIKQQQLKEAGWGPETLIAIRTKPDGTTEKIYYAG